MSRVFAVQQPTGRDAGTGAIKPTMDLSPALEYGELRFILRDWENPFSNPQSTADEVRRVMEEEGFNEGDWILLVGNPMLIGMVAAEAARLSGGLRMLQWSRSDHCYKSVAVQLYGEDGD